MVMSKSEKAMYDRAISVATKYQESHDKMEDLIKFLYLYKKMYSKYITDNEDKLIRVITEFLK